MVMTRVYGGCIEPGGYELADEHTDCTCPRCGGDARDWFIERNEGGSIETYGGLSCDGCGHREGTHPAEEWGEVWDAIEHIRPHEDSHDDEHDAPEPAADTLQSEQRGLIGPSGAPMLLDHAPTITPALPRRFPFLAFGAALGLLLGLLMVAIIRTAIAPGQPVGAFIVAIVAITYTGGGVLVAEILTASVRRGMV